MVLERAGNLEATAGIEPAYPVLQTKTGGYGHFRNMPKRAFNYLTLLAFCCR